MWGTDYGKIKQKGKNNMNKFIKTGISTILLITLLVTSITMPAKKTQAAKKAYCASLKLNNDIKLNKKKTYTKTGIYQEDTFFKEKKECKIKYTIESNRKASGKNYKVTYKVNYKFLDDPKLDTNKIWYDDWYWGLTEPKAFYTVFNYQTGKSLEVKNKLGVKVKGSKWNTTYYPAQTYKYIDRDTGLPREDYGEQEFEINNYKTISYSFTVTYPKTCKNVCVGIGFTNMVDNTGNDKNIGDNCYWNGKKPYGGTLAYKEGKKTMSYMRLNK